jgi:general nucleoside transport system permease protein
LSSGHALPRWVDLGLLPVFNLALAFLVSGAVLVVAGQDPAQALKLLLRGAFGSWLGFSYTLYYATTFVFTGLAVAVAYHAGLFNIGGEGQAMLGGMGTALVALWLGDSYPAWVVLPAMVLAAMAFGMVWGAIPGVLQAWRGSHVVITTIMFNFLASALLSWLLVEVLKEPSNMTVESRSFGPAAQVPPVHVVLAAMGIEWPSSPLNLSVLLAAAAVVLVWLWLWRGRSGYAIRVVGFAPGAAEYAGIRPGRQVVMAMAVSGALAGLVGINEVAGVHGRLLLDYVVGAGFAGIAVSLIGRNHPVGVVLAAILFGALYQGGAELSFEMPAVSRDMVFTLQGLIVLFCGALGQAAAPLFARLLVRAPRRVSAHG